MAAEEPEEGGMPTAPFWMTTYGDMVTLLLTFFILMFAMSSVNEQKFLKAAASLAGALGVLEKNVSVVGEKSPAIGVSGLAQEQLDMLESLEQIAEIFQVEALQDIASVDIIGPGEAVISMGDELLYDAGEAQLKPQALRVLEGIANSIRGRTEKVFVKGHTDNVPINTIQFPSNWHLSTSRAVTVVRLFEERGVPPEQLAAMGHGEFAPLESNDTPEGRRKNRRVELYITWSKAANE